MADWTSGKLDQRQTGPAADWSEGRLDRQQTGLRVDWTGNVSNYYRASRLMVAIVSSTNVEILEGRMGQ